MQMAKAQTRPGPVYQETQEGEGRVPWEAPEPGFRTRLGQVGLSTLLHLPSWAGGERAPRMLCTVCLF